MPLTDLLGQDRTVAILAGLLKNRTVAHAYLFSGEDGVGKTLAAGEFARALLCVEGGSDACGVCAACQRAAAGIHPDLHRITAPERQIRIDQVREIEERLSIRSFEGGYKVVVVEAADTMNPAAANAFLKTLEEPPPMSVLILVSARPDLLPDTIRSRTQRIRFYPLPRAEVLERTRAVFPESAALRTGLADGRLAVALDPDLETRRDGFIDSFDRMIRGSAEADEVWKDRADMDEWFDFAIVWIRDLMLCAVGSPENLLANRDRLARIRELAEGASLPRLSELLHSLFLLKARLRFNLNKALTFQHVLLQIRAVLG